MARQLANVTSAECVGVRASGGPLQNTTVEVHRGLNVLYGLNGAGKSRLLQALYTALTGSRDPVFAAPPTSVTAFLRISTDRLRHVAVPGDGQWLGGGALVAQVAAEVGAPVTGTAPEDAAGAFTYLVAASDDGGPKRRWCPAARVNDASRLAELKTLEDNILTRSVRAAAAGVWSVPAGPPTPSEEGRQLLEVLHTAPGFSDDEIQQMRTYEDMWEAAPYAAVERLFLTLCRNPDVGYDGAVLPLPDDGAGFFQELPHLDSGLPLRDGAVVPAALHPAVICETRSGRESVIDHLAGLVRAQPGLTEAAVDAIVTQIERQAREFLALLLPDPPDLCITLSSDPASMFTGDKVAVSSDGRPLDALSRAQTRWTNLAVTLASHVVASRRRQARDSTDADAGMPRAVTSQQTFVLLDEPEAALHRLAEAHMADGLAHLARAEDLTFVVATHSPALLNAADATVTRVLRVDREVVSDRGSHTTVETRRATVTRAMTEDDRELLSDLGLHPSDLVQRYRTIVLVEGVHDVQVLTHLLGDVLQRSRSLVLPVGGATKLPHVLDSQLLFRFTDATLVPLLDNLDQARVTQAWQAAIVADLAEGPGASQQVLDAAFPTSSGIENKYMRQFLGDAIKRSLTPRVEPFGLSAKDVLFYLPIEKFASNPHRDWPALMQAYADAKAQEKSISTSWKTWASDRCGYRFDPATITAALDSLRGTPLPDDVSALAAHLERQ